VRLGTITTLGEESMTRERYTIWQAHALQLADRWTFSVMIPELCTEYSKRLVFGKLISRVNRVQSIIIASIYRLSATICTGFWRVRESLAEKLYAC